MGALIQELFRTNLYKRSQGKIARQVTASVLGVIFGLAAWRFGLWLASTETIAKWISSSELSTGSVLAKRMFVHYGVPISLFIVGIWIAFRVVNLPSFANFLISVEAEMNKVTWPGRGELFRASLVVIVVMFFLAAALFFFDFVWKILFAWLGITQGGG